MEWIKGTEWKEKEKKGRERNGIEMERNKKSKAEEQNGRKWNRKEKEGKEIERNGNKTVIQHLVAALSGECTS